MAFSACILINKWHPRLPDVLASLQDCSSELILGINGEFNPEKYPVLKQFPRLKIVPLTWKGYGATKNELAGKAQNDWILSIDADEVADEQLQESLQQIDLKHEVEVYSVKRANYLGETLLQHGAWGNHKKAFVRLYHRKFTQWNEDPVHEKIAQKKENLSLTL